jgi:hypothetical protein
MGLVQLPHDSMVYTLVLANYHQGGGLVSLLDNDDALIRKDTLDRNKVVTKFYFGPRVPTRYSISLDSFTGTVSMSLGPFPVIPYYPIGVGCSWVYSVRDSFGLNSIDTVTIEVLSEETLPNGKSTTLQRYSSHSRLRYQFNYTEQVIIDHDTIRTLDGGSPKSLFVVPFSVGKGWRGPRRFGLDTSLVTAQGTVTVPSGTFSDAYYIKRSYQDVDSQYFENSWFVPKLGWVRILQASNGTIMTYYVWELISFRVVP